MPPQESPVELTIRNDVADLGAVTEALDRLGENIGFPLKALMQLQVALDEALSNVVKYAWPAGGTHEIRVLLEAHDASIVVVIEDRGLAFDPRAQPPPGPAGGRRPRPGGVGIHMVRQLVDRFDYERIDGLNRVTLTKQSVPEKASQEAVPDGK
jgi:anti-sigma regulatory factor (Ser/Thr protein kinase)